MTTYHWTPGAHVAGNAQSVGERLDALQRSNGERLTPRMVVDDARAEDSPLHNCFMWDDVRAGEMYRESQARLILRSIRVEDVNWATDVRVNRRVFVNVAEQVGADLQNAYVPISRVLASEDLRHQLIIQARKELQSFKRRYAEISELMTIVDDALAKVQQALMPEPIAEAS